MTREEAIRCLSVHSSTNGSGLCTDKQHYEAKQMAIKALEQEPCDDSISRQAVMNCFKKWQPYMATRLHEFEKELSELPSVAIPNKVGHWILHNEGYYDESYVCSRCDGDSPFDYKFCPYCGAKMVEPQESDHTCHTCHTCKHYTSGEHDGSCGSYICKGYSDWESEE